MRSIRFSEIVILAFIAAALPADATWAFPQHGRGQRLKGPWEILVQMGMQGQPIAFPLSVSDENKPEKIDKTLPVVGTPVTIKLEQYLSDLRWETAAAENPGGGIVARIAAKGKNLDQQIWLSSEEESRQTTSSSIGSVTVRRLSDPNIFAKLMKKLKQGEAAGVLSVRPKGMAADLQYVVTVGQTITVPKSNHKITVVSYFPHYSIDTTTKQVTNLSDKPVNPAVMVSIDDGQNTRQQWLWSRYASPHMHTAESLVLKFADFDLGGMEARYIVAAVSASEAWILHIKDGKVRAEKAVLAKEYPFLKEGYSFAIEQILDHAVVETKWKNGSEKLLNPAIVATIRDGQSQEQVVMELGKPHHQKAESGTMVIVYRQKQQPAKGG
jgi:hypothetical protein